MKVSTSYIYVCIYISIVNAGRRITFPLPLALLLTHAPQDCNHGQCALYVLYALCVCVLARGPVHLLFRAAFHAIRYSPYKFTTSAKAQECTPSLITGRSGSHGVQPRSTRGGADASVCVKRVKFRPVLGCLLCFTAPLGVGAQVACRSHLGNKLCSRIPRAKGDPRFY